MRIESSTVSMAATRSYQAQVESRQTTITRSHDGSGTDEGKVISVGVVNTRTSVYEAHGSAAVYGMSSGGMALEDQREDGMNSTRVLAGPVRGQEKAAFQAPAAVGSTRNWLADFHNPADDDPMIQMLRRCLDLLAKVTGRPVNENTRLGGRRLGSYIPAGAFSAASAGYRRTMAAEASFSRASIRSTGVHMSLAAAPDAGLGAAGGGEVNGHWTRQVIQVGVARGEEQTGFRSTGTAVTSDGRTIDFGITVAMSRSFETAFALVGKEEVYTDPLVINLDTDAASLADVTFTFDLDGDGRAEELNRLGAGSGFLAYDKNGDGVINDGTELFGAKTGDGFAELSRYDEDGNGWIDENDSIFSKLSVWVQCGDGEGKLLSLSEADVGAIFLGSQDTRFTLEAGGGEAGVIRRTGLYLRESGSVGTVQHLDYKA